MAKSKIKLDRQSVLYYKAMREVRELPQCADYKNFCKESHNRWLKLMLNENLINIKQYRGGLAV
jgi:hypothetical protein|tara:strand:- start:197 stop:388 length:192 start_codon:yes stop_codon:yes gene_type:complete